MDCTKFSLKISLQFICALSQQRKLATEQQSKKNDSSLLDGFDEKLSFII